MKEEYKIFSLLKFKYKEMGKGFVINISRSLFLSLFVIVYINANSQVPLLHNNYEDAFLNNQKKPCLMDENFDVVIHKSITNQKAISDLYNGLYNVNMPTERVCDFLRKASVVSCYKVNYVFDIAPVNGTLQGEIVLKNGNSFLFEYAFTGYGFLYDEKNKIIWGLGNPKIINHSDTADEDSVSTTEDAFDYKLLQYPNEISL